MNIWLKENELTKNTILGGNLDVDLYVPCIADAQRIKLEEVLGETLFKKIDVDFGNDALTGLYLTCFNDYIKPFLIHQSAVEYLKIGAFKVENNGIFKPNTDKAVSADTNDINWLVKEQRLKAEMYQGRLERWLYLNQLPEYNSSENKIIPPLNKGSVLQRIYFCD